jgi:hypothetical protein
MKVIFDSSTINIVMGGKKILGGILNKVLGLIFWRFVLILVIKNNILV